MQSLPKTLCDVAAERALLAAVVLDNTKLQAISQKLKSPDFILKSHQTIYRVILEMNAKSLAIDFVTLQDALNSAGQLESIGGTAYIASLMDPLYRVANVHAYAEIVQTKSLQRALAHATDTLAKQALDANLDPFSLLDQAERRLSELRSSVPRAGDTRIEKWEEIQTMSSIPEAEVAWLVDNIVPDGGLVLMAGQPGSYKSFLALVLARAVATGGSFLGKKCTQREVLILDRENPQGVICERARILGMKKMENIRIWGGWDKDQPPLIGDPRLLRIARERKPLIIVDSFIRFHDADENSATEMAPIMAHLRALANAGATVVLIHHRTKADSSRYRGSSDILGGVDVAFSVARNKDSGVISVACFKTRYSEEFELSLRPELGEKRDFVVVNFTETDREEADINRLIELMEKKGPRINQSQILADGVMGEKRCLSILKKGIGRQWKVEPGPRNSHLYTALPRIPFIIED